MTEPFRVGPYEAGEFIARSAYGSVCHVTNPDDGRRLVARLYPATGVPAPRQLTRWHEEFVEEVERLREYGRDLVPIVEGGRVGDLAWIVREPAAGQFLHEVPAQGAMTPESMRRLLPAVGSALDRLHEAGLVHRGLKPSNVVLDGDGGVRFMDTQLLGRFAEATLAGGLPLGRVRWASPEAILGYRQDAAANRYTLAVMAYWLLTASMPHREGNAIDYSYASIYSDPQAPGLRRPDLPTEVDAVMLRALSREREDRFATGAEFAERLCAALEVESARNDDRVVTPGAYPAPHEAASAPGAAPQPVSPPGEVELEWFAPSTRVLEIEPEPLPDPPARLRAVPDSVVETEPRDGCDAESAPDAGSEAGPPPPPARRQAGGLARRIRSQLLRLVPQRPAPVGRDEVEAADSAPAWTEALAPEWTLEVVPKAAGWLRVDGRYAGPAPAEVTVRGRSGQRILVELMRDGLVVARTRLRLHPLMDRTWAPTEP